ncbi:MAG: UDP-N-acetylmuramate dehydrogenase [Actinomycetia bacterium]|nr:UDP-N-acetylmuramate dehydrogenase [Actinomycetes bacterium]
MTASAPLFDELYCLLDRDLDGCCRRDEPLSRHTSYRIGGPAALWVVADSIADLRRVHEVAARHGVEIVVLGRGTNILASDRGFEGICLVLGPSFRSASFKEDTATLTAGAGVLLARLVQETQRAGLAGLEFAAGIPGTLGGAVAGNAGSRDEWIGALIIEVTVFAQDSGLRRLRAGDIDFSYRSSSLRDQVTIVDGRLRLRPDDAQQIASRIEGALTRRKASQPLFSPSAGSVFKNPEGASAGKLIEAVGMKGAVRGDAQVSELHANFIINRGSARASDVAGLIAEVRDKVDSKYGIELKPEIRFLGTFDER